MVPASRIRPVNGADARPVGDYVLYWMVAARRLRANFGLQRAVELARAWKRPLVVLEALRCDYRWASDRQHRFVIDGMAEHAAALADTPVRYVPYVEPESGGGHGLLQALAARACVVVTDDFPCFFLPRMIEAAGAALPLRLEAVDSNGVLPIRATDRAFPTAYAFRAYIQRTFREHLVDWPAPLDLSDLPGHAVLPDGILERWPPAEPAELEAPSGLLARLPIDHDIGMVTSTHGGSAVALAQLRRFVVDGLPRYIRDRNQPDEPGTSGLSPYLHFGHISAHEVFEAVVGAEGWTSRQLGGRAGGKRGGWWGMSPPAEAFLDQLITWRELALNTCATRPDDYWTVDSLPDWARRTLAAHASDSRSYVYGREQFALATTHDPVWNAAQRQLVRDGWMHNYLRMLWGKKILEWSPSPTDALETMIDVMNRYALDGRDPNSYAGYCWALGRYDRPWGPERPVYGTVRYMSSDNTKRKLRLRNYLERYGEQQSLI